MIVRERGASEPAEKKGLYNAATHRTTRCEQIFVVVSFPDVPVRIKGGGEITDRMIDPQVEQSCQPPTENAESSHASICK